MSKLSGKCNHSQQFPSCGTITSLNRSQYFTSKIYRIFYSKQPHPASLPPQGPASLQPHHTSLPPQGPASLPSQFPAPLLRQGPASLPPLGPASLLPQDPASMFPQVTPPVPFLYQSPMSLGHHLHQTCNSPSMQYQSPPLTCTSSVVPDQQFVNNNMSYYMMLEKLRINSQLGYNNSYIPWYTNSMA